MDEEYIILSRDFDEWKWFHDSKVLIVFTWLLLEANTKTTFYGRDRIDRGMIATKNEIIAESCGLTIANVRTALSKLESTGDISRERRSRYQIITINDFERYKD